MVIRGRGALQPELPTEMTRLERLNGTVPYKVFENIEHYSGMSDPQLAALLKVRPGRLAEALAQINRGEDKESIAAAVARFNEATGEDEISDRSTVGSLLRQANRGELLVRMPVYTGPAGGLTSNAASVPLLENGTVPAPRFHMHYVSVEGSIVIEHRDVTSLNAIRRRFNEDIRKDHNRYAPQLPHTHQLNDCIVSMSLHGYLVSAGYRGALYLPGGQQLVPDARMTALLYLDDSPIEYIRGGDWIRLGAQGRAAREEIRQQLRRYIPAARQLGGLTVACLCDTETAIEVAREEAATIARDYDVALHALAVLEKHCHCGCCGYGQPDFVRPLFVVIKWYVEYERSATTRGEIRDKLMPYFRVVRRGYDCAVIFICETEKAAETFRQQHRNLQREIGVSFPLITSTYTQVTAGDQFDTCWILYGKAARLLQPH